MTDTPDGSRSLKRHPALVPLSRDHHFALIQAFAMRRVAESAFHGGPGPVTVAESYLSYYNDQLVGHMADEEQCLLPPSANVRPEHAARLVADHDDLRERTALLRQALEDGLDLRAMLLELGERLYDHVRFEERELFEELQVRMTGEQLDGIGTQIEDRRRARGRGPGCAVPRPSPNR
jgi:hypothetical protein